MGVGGEEGDESEGAEDVGDGEQSLGDQGGVPHLPLLPGTRGVILEEGDAWREKRRRQESMRRMKHQMWSSAQFIASKPKRLKRGVSIRLWQHKNL